MTDPKTIRLFAKDKDARAEPGKLVHLSDLDGYAIEDPAPDLRGWSVKLRDGGALGTVDDLIVDTDQLTVNYLEVKLGKEFRTSSDNEWVIVPMQAAYLDLEHEDVIVNRLPARGMAEAPRFRTGNAPRLAPTTTEALHAASSWEPLTTEGGAIEEIQDDRPIAE
ncbi:MAG TPA: PRC-barrel domain-containing protein [Gemmatimonadaceae bacterium]|nr:PRC-barrel domain-containing protein [Gemmatimonadaceae bacterium]